MYERNADVPKSAFMIVAHNSRGSPTIPCTESNEEEVVATTLATTVATTPNLAEDVLAAPQVIVRHSFAAPVSKERPPPPLAK